MNNSSAEKWRLVALMQIKYEQRRSFPLERPEDRDGAGDTKREKGERKVKSEQIFLLGCAKANH